MKFLALLLFLALHSTLLSTPGFAKGPSAGTPAPVASGGSNPHTGHLGLGLILGDPTGLTAHYPFQLDRSMHFGLAYAFNDFFLIYGDYIFRFHHVQFIPAPARSTLEPYVGLGLALIFTDRSPGVRKGGYFDTNSSAGLGIRIPLGLEWKPVRAPIGVFLEIVPGIGILPSTYDFVQGGIGAAFYFD